MVLVQTDDEFQPDIPTIEAALTPRTRAIIVNSPNNPSGAIYTEEKCRELAQMVARHDSADHPIYIALDDPYRRIIYDRDKCPTPAQHYPRTIIVSSYSKDLSIAGERAGYIAVPHSVPDRKLVLGAMAMLNRTLGFVNASAFMQRVIASCADALCDVSFYRENRDLLCNALLDYGYELNVPGGALYAFPRTPLADDAEFVDVLMKHKILAVPGRGFGRPGYMRLSFCVDRKTIERGPAGVEGGHRGRAVALGGSTTVRFKEALNRMIIAVINSKGGVGKSTLAVHAASWLHARGYVVAAVDADAQNSTAEWLTRAEPTIRIERCATSREIADRVPRLRALYDVIVIDGPAAMSAETVASAVVADLALLPIGPSMMDISASYRTARLLYKIRFNPKRAGLPNVFVVLNRVQPRTRLARIAASATLKYGFPVANHALQLRQAYAEACGEGTVVWRIGSRGRKAADEISALFEQVFSGIAPRARPQPATNPPR